MPTRKKRKALPDDVKCGCCRRQIRIVKQGNAQGSIITVFRQCRCAEFELGQRCFFCSRCPDHCRCPAYNNTIRLYGV